MFAMLKESSYVNESTKERIKLYTSSQIGLSPCETTPTNQPTDRLTGKENDLEAGELVFTVRHTGF